MGNNMFASGIIGVDCYVPSKIITNADLEKMVDTSDEWIKTRTGISERHIADPETATSDLATLAALKAIEDAGIEAGDIDLIIVATITPDMPFPSTACLVQERIGAKNAACFDLAAGCSGFVYALSVASQFISNGTYRYALVIGAEILSRIVDWSDRSTCVLFGDGAGAAVVGRVPEGKGFLSFELGADGGGADLLKIEAGGSRHPATDESLAKGLHFIRMNGNQVFKFAMNIMGEAAIRALERCGLTAGDIDFFIPHQANSRIIDAAARKLNLDSAKVFKNVDRYGNTSAASIPIAFREALDLKKINEGDIVILVGFGAGLTWAASVIRW